eukprot:1036141-Pyramimonas_sp.AAC.2
MGQALLVLHDGLARGAHELLHRVLGLRRRLAWLLVRLLTRLLPACPLLRLRLLWRVGDCLSAALVDPLRRTLSGLLGTISSLRPSGTTTGRRRRRATTGRRRRRATRGRRRMRATLQAALLGDRRLHVVRGPRLVRDPRLLERLVEALGHVEHADRQRRVVEIAPRCSELQAAQDISGRLWVSSSSSSSSASASAS